jgi:DNA-binding NtrC family response regulator
MGEAAMSLIEDRPAAIAGLPPEVLSESMQRLHALTARVAAARLTVLISGETGAGKEVLARRLHELSPRAGKPFMAINCAGLPSSLMESEVFGHERGAFTGALTARCGLFEAAQGGTVLLDEIGELPVELQAKLLRAIEERVVLPVGAVRPRPIDVRFLAATNRDLEAEVRQGRFRGDLYFRLSGITLEIPPLRERSVEIPALVRHFLRGTQREGRPAPPRLSDEALAILQRQPWPGNVRELRNVVERATLFCDGEELGPVEVEAALGLNRVECPVSALAPATDERSRIVEALRRCGGNQTRAARMLGISRRTLIERLKRYDLPRPRANRAGFADRGAESMISRAAAAAHRDHRAPGNSLHRCVG